MCRHSTPRAQCALFTSNVANFYKAVPRASTLALVGSADGFGAQRAYHKATGACLDQVWVML